MFVPIHPSNFMKSTNPIRKYIIVSVYSKFVNDAKSEKAPVHYPLLFPSRMISILLDMIISSILFSVPPKIVPFSFESPIYAGESTQVTCLVSQGDKPLDIQWFYNTSSADGISTQSVGNKGSLLLIDAAGYDHKGHYTCRVKNSAGIAEFTALLNVHGTHCCLRSKPLYRLASFTV